MKIIVTGGAGFIASHIVDAYIADGHEVIVIDDLSTGKKEFVNKAARFYEADIRDKKQIEDIIHTQKPDVINHHAAQISVRESVEDPLNDLEVNLIGLLNLLESSKKIGLKKFIFASSGGVVYGEADILPTPESYTPLKPQSPYGVTKLASEYYLHFYYQHYKIPYIALRYSNVYGPRQNPHGEAGVVAIFANKLLQSEIPVINGDGLQTRDYIYISDVVNANVRSLKTPTVGSFNVGTGIETNVIEIFKNLRSIIGSKINAKHGPPKFGEQRRSCLDCNLARKILNWEAKVKLKEGLIHTVEYFQSMTT